MIPCIEKIPEDFPEKIAGTIMTMAAYHLFSVRTESGTIKLPEEQAISCHHNVAKLLFISN